MLDTILPFIGILLGLVILHELGHFVVAKLAGVRVEEFGIGMPPRIAGIRFGETLYSINWLPLGGFVRLTGEESARVFVATVNAQSAAARAGLRAGDVILKVDGTPVHSDEQLAKQLRLAAADSGPIPIEIEREQQGARGAELGRRTLLLEPQTVPATATAAAARPAGPAAEIGSIAGIQTSPDPRSSRHQAAPRAHRRDGGRRRHQLHRPDRALRRRCAHSPSRARGARGHHLRRRRRPRPNAPDCGPAIA